VETKEIVYFDEPGPSNTDAILEMAKDRIQTLGIETVVIASQAGVTVKRFLQLMGGANVDIVVVTNPKGPGLNITVLYDKYENSKKIKEEYRKKGVTHFRCSISDEDRSELQRLGVRIIEQKDYLNIGDPWGLQDEEKLSARDL